METDNLKLLKQTIEAAGGVKTVELPMLNRIQLVMVPDGYSLKDLDHYRARPRRLVQKQIFATIEAFAEYVNKWAPDESALLRGELYKADQSKIGGPLDSCSTLSGTITAVLDYHEGVDAPSWCSHIAVLSSDLTPELKTWGQREKDRFSQRTFRHFLEDNAMDISDPDLASLIAKVQDVKIGSSGGRTSSVTTTVEDQSSHKRVEIESGLPDIILLALRPWRFCDKYEVKARPFLHVEDGAIQFSYHLINIDRVLEAAFNDVVTNVEALIGRKVLI